jgi:hypothetical protein
VSSKRRRVWLGFALTAALGLVSLFVLDGAVAGIASLLTMLAFIGACIYAARGGNPDARPGVTGWIGGWF